MTRKKVELAYITSDSKRKAALRKRKNGLIKKIDEISTLCGIESCAIIYSPNDPQPQVWPSPSGVQRVLSKFMTMPELEQSKKMLNQESFLEQRILKAQEQLKKQRNDNRVKEMTHLMFQYLNAGQTFGNLSMVDLNDLSWVIDQNLKEIDKKINQIEGPKAVENGAEIQSGGEQASMEHDQMMETKVDAMQNQHLSMEFINYGVPQFGDVSVPNVLWPNPQFP